MYAICQRNEEKLNQIGDAFGIEKRYTDYDELLKAQQDKRAAGRFALIGLAGELATEYGLTGWQEGDRVEAYKLVTQRRMKW